MKLKPKKIRAIKELAARMEIPFYTTAKDDKNMHFKRIAEMLWLYSPGIDNVVSGSTLHDFATTKYSKVSRGFGTTFQDVSRPDMHKIRIDINNRYMSIGKLERLVTDVAIAYQSIKRRISIDAAQAERLVHG